jgi:V/A-type H+-transporting ATPase subunit A
VGPEALQDRDRLSLEAAEVVRESVLAQSAYDPNDAVSAVDKTYRLASLARALYRAGLAALEAGAGFERLDLGPARRALAALRRAAPDELAARAAEAETAIAALGGAGLAA